MNLCVGRLPPYSAAGAISHVQDTTYSSNIDLVFTCLYIRLQHTPPPPHNCNLNSSHPRSSFYFSPLSSSSSNFSRPSADAGDDLHHKSQLTIADRSQHPPSIHRSRLSFTAVYCCCCHKYYQFHILTASEPAASSSYIITSLFLLVLVSCQFHVSFRRVWCQLQPARFKAAAATGCWRGEDGQQPATRSVACQ